MANLLHALFGTHLPDPAHTRWVHGHFTSVCTACRRDMVQIPGLPWRAGRAR